MPEPHFLKLAFAEPGPDGPSTLVEGAYQRLRRDIISGVRAPGEKLRVEHLKDEYEVGAGTLREALARLASDTLVVVQGQRGFSVSPLSLEDLEDLTRTRVHLETEALRQSIAHGDDAWESRVVAAFHRLTLAEEKLSARNHRAVFENWEQQNAAFHEALLSASPSHWLRHLLTIVYHQSERYRHASLVTHPSARDVHSEHRAIFEAAIARETRKATALVAQHISIVLDRMRELPPEAFQKRSLKAVRSR